MELIHIIQQIHFASFCWMLLLPASMMGIDVVTGLIKAWINHDFQSAIMRAGLAKKAGELLIIVMGLLFTYGMGLPTYILSCVSLYIILMELMSIVENLDKIGCPLPKALKDVINNVGHAVQEDDITELKARITELEAILNGKDILSK